MRISFDLDHTLIPHGRPDPPERGRLPACMLRRLGEPLRQGTVELMRTVRQRGWSIWIYTTSDRGPARIRFWLALHGLRVDGVVNQTRHQKAMADHGLSRLPSKYPPAFGIELHVDDSEGVAMEGKELGFEVVVVRPEDGAWAKKVLSAADRVVDSPSSSGPSTY